MDSDAVTSVTACIPASFVAVVSLFMFPVSLVLRTVLPLLTKGKQTASALRLLFSLSLEEAPIDGIT